MLKRYRAIKLQKKLIILCLVFFFPLAALGVFMDISFIYDINLARTELTGNAFQKKLAPLLDNGPRLCAANLASGGYSRPNRPARIQETNQAFQDLRAALPGLAPDMAFVPSPGPSKLAVKELLDDLEAQWRGESGLSLQTPAECELFMRRLAELCQNLADCSRLRLDPALDSNYLADATLKGAPLFMLRVQKAMGLAAQRLAHPKASRPMLLENLRDSAALMQEVLQDHIVRSSAIALREDPSAYGKSPGLHTDYAQALQNLRRKAEQLRTKLLQLAEQEPGVRLEELVRLWTETHQATMDFYEIGAHQLGVLLDKRLASYRTWRIIAYLCAAAALAVTILLVALIGRDITRPLQQIMDYTRRVARGDYNARLPDMVNRDMAALARDVQSMVAELKRRLAYNLGILESIAAPFLVTDVSLRISFVNMAMLQLREQDGEPEDHLGRDALEFFGNHERVRDFLGQCLEERVCVENQEVELPGLRGGSAVASVTVSPLYDMEDHLIGASIFIFDLTDLKSREREILESQARIDQLAAFPMHNPRPVLAADPSGQAVYRNPAADDVLQSLDLDLSTFTPPTHEDIVRHCLDSGQNRLGVEHEVRNRYFLWNYNPLPEHDLVHIHVMDDTERKRMEEQLVHDAFHDALTGLPNRALLLDRAEQRLDHARRSPGMFALFFIDLDRFKTINDSLGHTVGDALLVQAAEAMVRAMGDCCTLARLGGDEFVVLVDEITDESDALELAQTLQHAVAGPFTVDGLDIAATASIGVVVDEGAYPDAETMLRDADTAMYRAKASGRAQCALFDEAMHETARKRLDLEMDLNRALGGDQLVAFYQPIVCLRTGRITGFEALLRWLHPERGLISPGDFIPVAEETGLIVPIGLDVLEQACTQAQAWRRLREDLGELMMSVNLSVRQFRSPTLLEDIRGVLERTGFPGRLLKLEITESGVMEHGPRAKEIMAGLEDMGASLSIDDFGTGYSSLSYLPRFPFHSLKVDRSFVMRMHEPDNLGIVQTIVALAHDMDKEVIAEGVETEAMLAVLREMGCEYAQGFLFAKPLPPEEAQTLLEQAPRW